MKIFAIGFTKTAISVLKQVQEVARAQDWEGRIFLSPRIYEENCPDDGEMESASLAEFTQRAWQEAEAILYVGAAGIAVRAIAPYVTKKDRDPAVLIADERADYVIPVLSGHIGGANALALLLADALGAVPVITTATDLQGKLAIDAWAAEQGYAIADTRQIVKISSAVLEGREILLYGPEAVCEELGFLYEGFRIRKTEFWEGDLDQMEEDIQAEIRETGLPAAVCTPYVLEKIKGEVLHLIPRVFFAGMGARKGADPEAVRAFYLASLRQYRIHPASIRSISSIDLKKEETALLELTRLLPAAKKGERALSFFSASELAEAERYTGHVFAPSKLVQSVTGVDNVCERAAVLGAVKHQKEHCQGQGKGELQLKIPKTKGGQATLALAEWKERG